MCSMMALLLCTAIILASAEAQLKSFDFVARTYHAAGYMFPGIGNSKPDLYGYGLGALAKIVHDPKEHFIYGVSEQGYLTLIDMANGPANAEQLDFAIAFRGITLSDVALCEGYLFLAAKDGPDNGIVRIYTTTKRTENGEIDYPNSVAIVPVGVSPVMIMPNPSCDILGVANQGEGVYDEFLVDPPGSITLIKGPFNETLEVVSVPLDKWTESELIEKEVHLSLPLNAMEYWDDHSELASGLNLTAARASYQPANNLEPTHLAWSEDGSTLFVNLQENCALVTVDAASGEATGIFSYGLKDWSTTGIDVVNDSQFTSVMVEGLFTTRSPSSISTFNIGGESYIATANVGESKSYGEYKERLKCQDIFMGSELPKQMTADISVFDPNDIKVGVSRHFNVECDPTALPFCSSAMEVTVGTSMVDFSNPSAPHIHRLVGVGGRGISIYKLAGSELVLVWDSADQFEREGYAAFPWAHNGLQDRSFSPIGGTLYPIADDDLREEIKARNNPQAEGCDDQGDMTSGACPLGQTVDNLSTENGVAAAVVAVGEACGEMYMVTVTRTNSVGYLYKVGDVTSPELVRVFHLSEISETFSPGLAYDAGTLGEIGCESIVFLGSDESATGNAAVVFAGALSGTISYWEYNCEELSTTSPVVPPTLSPVSDSTLSPITAIPETSTPATMAPVISPTTTAPILSPVADSTPSPITAVPETNAPSSMAPVISPTTIAPTVAPVTGSTLSPITVAPETAGPITIAPAASPTKDPASTLSPNTAQPGTADPNPSSGAALKLVSMEVVLSGISMIIFGYL